MMSNSFAAREGLLTRIWKGFRKYVFAKDPVVSPECLAVWIAMDHLHPGDNQPDPHQVAAEAELPWSNDLLDEWHRLYHRCDICQRWTENFCDRCNECSSW